MNENEAIDEARQRAWAERRAYYVYNIAYDGTNDWPDDEWRVAPWREVMHSLPQMHIGTLVAVTGGLQFSGYPQEERNGK